MPTPSPSQDSRLIRDSILAMDVPDERAGKGGRRLTDALVQDGIGHAPEWKGRLAGAFDCTGRSLELIEEHQRLMVVAPGSTIFFQGAQPDAVCLLQRGQMQMIACLGDREAPLGTIEPGMFCDLAACILNGPHHHTTRAVTTCDLITLPIAIWRQMAEQSPSVLRLAIGHLGDDLRRVVDQLSASGPTTTADR